MYSWERAGVKRAGAASHRVWGACLAAAVACGGGVGTAQDQSTRPLVCDAALTALFTPARPQLGRYEVCTTPDPISEVVEAGRDIASAAPLDAFGAAGAYDRAGLAQLYGGQRVRVAYAWTESAGRFESLTFISPYPDRSMRALLPGTLVIRHILEGGDLAALPGSARRRGTSGG
jgi:hypothetical protein